MLPSFGPRKSLPPAESQDTPTQAEIRSLLTRFLHRADLPAGMGPLCANLLRALSGEQLMQVADVVDTFAREMQTIRARHAA
jgi:hypothetical protein